MCRISQYHIVLAVKWAKNSIQRFGRQMQSVSKKIFFKKKSSELPNLPDLKNEVYTTIWADSEPILKKEQRARILGPSDIFQHT